MVEMIFFRFKMREKICDDTSLEAMHLFDFHSIAEAPRHFYIADDATEKGGHQSVPSSPMVICL